MQLIDSEAEPLSDDDSTGPLADVPISKHLKRALKRASSASRRETSSVSVERLLLALTEDVDAASVMQACNVDPHQLRRGLSSLIANPTSPTDTGRYQAAMQRAAAYVASSETTRTMTGAHVLAGIVVSELSERLAKLLSSHGLTRFHVLTYICHGLRKDEERPVAEDDATSKSLDVKLLNDDYTPMEFVFEALRSIFDLSEARAKRVMLSAHRTGSEVCGTYASQVARDKIAKLKELARAHDHPLQCVASKPKYTVEMIEWGTMKEGSSSGPGYWFKRTAADGSETTSVHATEGLTDEAKRLVFEREFFGSQDVRHFVDVLRNDNSGDWVQRYTASLVAETRKVDFNVTSLIIPDHQSLEGVLVKSTSLVWEAIVAKLSDDWMRAFDIPPHTWEEIVAGAFHKAGFDQVTLTPRSGDLGRDVIAVRKGIGTIKIIGSVKAYKPGNLVKHDDVRALLGVLSGEQDASKGIITTTSDFAPRVRTDRFIMPFLPTRLELVNGSQLQSWLRELTRKP